MNTKLPQRDDPLLHPLEGEYQDNKKMMVWIAMVGAISSLVITGAFFITTLRPDASLTPSPTPGQQPFTDKTTDDLVRLINSNVLPTAMPGNATLMTITDAGPAPLTSFIQSDTENYTTALPVLGDNGNFYFINDSMVIEQSLSSNTQKTVAPLAIPEKMIVSRITNHDNFLYITYAPDDYYGEGSTFQIQVINVLTKEERKIQNLKPVFYGGIEYLFKSGNSDILASFGGDGCGGWGELYRYSGNKGLNTIVKTGAGCSKDPRFLGVVEQKNAVALASIVYSEDHSANPEELFEFPYDKLFLQDVSTGSKEELFSFSTLPDKVKKVILDDSGSKVAMITDTEIMIFNIATKTIESTKEAAMKNLWPVKFIGTQLYSNDYTGQAFSVLDVTTGIGKTYAWKQLSGNAAYSPQLLGIWDNKPIFIKYDQAATQ